MIKKICALFIALMFVVSCSGSGGGGGDKEGTVSFDITDAKPMLPEGVTSVFVTIDEVTIHSANGKWQTLPLKETPFTIDLLEFINGETAELVPPVVIPPGTYTQLRLSVVESFLRVTNPDQTTEDFPVEIPSGNLKTDSPFNVDLLNKGRIDMVIDFDLSQSLVVTGSGKYKLKPVLHIVETKESVIFEGFILNTLFIVDEIPIVTVYDSNGVIRTQVAVAKAVSPATESLYEIFWIVPDKDYKVEIDYDPTVANGPEFIKDITAASIPPGTTLLVE